MTGILMPNTVRVLPRLKGPFGDIVRAASREESALFDPPPR
jgi:hypothetical protein